MESREIRFLRVLIREQLEEIKTGIFSEPAEKIASTSTEIGGKNIKNMVMALGNAHQAREVVSIIEKLVTAIKAKDDKRMMAVVPNLRKVQEYIAAGRLTTENPKYFDAITSIGGALMRKDEN